VHIYVHPLNAKKLFNFFGDLEIQIFSPHCNLGSAVPRYCCVSMSNCESGSGGGGGGDGGGN
jgi:hypothetical protein